jgi:hypothetical protein
MMSREARPPQGYDDEVRRAVSYEKGLAVKALIAVAIVAVLIVARLLGG